MVIVKLMGGLGNQMFQYACVRHLSVILNTPLKLDLSFFETPGGNKGATPRAYELGVWGIQTAKAEVSEVAPFLSLGQEKKEGLLNRLFQASSKRVYYKEKDFRFDPNVLNSVGDIYLDGHWQSEKYFLKIEDVIRREFQPMGQLDQTNQDLVKEFSSTESVSIHVRRKDYLKDKAALEFHGVCSLEYYKQAVQFMSKKHGQIRLYIFSDDPEWSEANLKFGLPMTHVLHNRDEKSYLDLWMMSRCRHQIIANSSFSWWGAWLNPYSQKSVIAPARWFAGPKPDSSDLIPSTWTCL